MSTFVPFSSRADLIVRRRYLPHWEQRDGTYFVTFRLADSLPAEIRDRLAEMRELSPDAQFEYIDTILAEGAGSCCLSRPDRSAIVESSLRHFDGTRYRLGDYVIMPNHVHVLVQPMEEWRLAQVIHSWKSFTAHTLRRRGLANDCIWQRESFDRLVRNDVELARFKAYIAENPSAANLAEGSFVIGRGSADW